MAQTSFQLLRGPNIISIACLLDPLDCLSVYEPQPPHWVIIDMSVPRRITGIDTYRHTAYPDTKSILYYVSDEPYPNADTWVKIMEGAYESTAVDHHLTLYATEFAVGRYLKIYLPDTFRNPYNSIREIDVYGF
jgi:allantoicase